MSEETKAEVVPVETKGLLNSKTIWNVLGLLLVNLGTLLVTNWTTIQGFILGLVPPLWQPVAVGILAAVAALLNIFFGAGAIKGRIAVGDLQGLYKK